MARSDQAPQTVRELAQNDPGKPLDDYLAESGLAKTPRDWNSYKTSLRRACSKGGSLHDMVVDGTICCTPADKTREQARAERQARYEPSWVAEAQVAEPQQDRNVRTAGSTNMLATIDHFNGGISPTSRHNLEKIAELTKSGITERRWEQVSEMVHGIAEREALALADARHQKELAAKDREMAAEFKRVNVELTSLAHILAEKLQVDVGTLVPAPRE